MGIVVLSTLVFFYEGLHKQILGIFIPFIFFLRDILIMID